jgi:RimJ/RimL family protein N-acetyltransferase
MEDVDALEKIAYDPMLWANTMTLIRERKDLELYVRQAVDEERAGSAVPFVTTIKEGNLVVGSTRFAAIDRINRRAEIGWTWMATDVCQHGGEVPHASTRVRNVETPSCGVQDGDIQ